MLLKSFPMNGDLGQFLCSALRDSNYPCSWLGFFILNGPSFCCSRFTWASLSLPIAPSEHGCHSRDWLQIDLLRCQWVTLKWNSASSFQSVKMPAHRHVRKWDYGRSNGLAVCDHCNGIGYRIDRDLSAIWRRFAKWLRAWVRVIIKAKFTTCTEHKTTLGNVMNGMTGVKTKTKTTSRMICNVKSAFIVQNKSIVNNVSRNKENSHIIFR
jgi:hypothetical protein